MGYGWIYPYRIYGFWKRDPEEEFESGKITEEEMNELEKVIPREKLTLSDGDLERLGIQRHIGSVYKNRVMKIVYGIPVKDNRVDEGVDEIILAKVQRAAAMLEYERHIPITIGYHSCVETDMAQI